MSSKVFRTKTGYCHIFPDKIILSNNPDINSDNRATEKNNIGWRLTIYFALSVYLFYKSVTLYQEDEMRRFALHLFVGTVLIYTILKSINNSSARFIKREKIKEVKFHEASAGTRAYFSVSFENDRGKLKKRLIMLPGSLSGGKEETTKAKAIMTDENLLSYNTIPKLF